MKKRALISVSDKTGIIEFAQSLEKLGFEIVSTGGSAKKLSAEGIKVIPIDEVTGFPEIMNGRVKTLHPKVHGGILAVRENENHIQQAKELGINFIDLVCVNLYPFAKTVRNPESSHEDIIENIDIGGPTMVRSAAKNYSNVAIVTDQNDYEKIISELKDQNTISLKTKEYLAKKAFEHTANYDRMIANYFQKRDEQLHPDFVQISEPIKEALRYGENPHQNAAYYEDEVNSIITQVHGKQLSFNNYSDIDGALRIIEKFRDKPACAIIKHTNPSGIATGENLLDAYKKAFATDTLSPFGGIVIVNKELDLETALEINTIFTEIILAPSYSEEALTKLMKKKNRRLLTYCSDKLYELENQLKIKTCMNGFLVQENDMQCDNKENWKIVTERQPTEEELIALDFGWKSVATLKSNAVCFTTKDQTIGLGIGQTSRIDSTEIALRKAEKFGLDIKGTICASDAFFPFRDSVDEIAKYGITAIIQPGGSKGDEEVIQACNEHGIAMIFTGMRHFLH